VIQGKYKRCKSKQAERTVGHAVGGISLWCELLSEEQMSQLAGRGKREFVY